MGHYGSKSFQELELLHGFSARGLSRPIARSSSNPKSRDSRHPWRSIAHRRPRRRGAVIRRLRQRRHRSGVSRSRRRRWRAVVDYSRRGDLILILAQPPGDVTQAVSRRLPLPGPATLQIDDRTQPSSACLLGTMVSSDAAALGPQSYAWASWFWSSSTSNFLLKFDFNDYARRPRKVLSPGTLASSAAS